MFMEAPNNSELVSDPKPQVIYRCKKYRRIVASQELIVPHERGGGHKCFKWRKKKADLEKMNAGGPAECSSIFVEPMKWMESVHEGFVEISLV